MSRARDLASNVTALDALASDATALGASYAIDAFGKLDGNGAAAWAGFVVSSDAIMRETTPDDRTTPTFAQGYGTFARLPSNIGISWYSNDTTGLLNATSIVAGKYYIIQSVGTTDFVALGAPSNTPTVGFWATAAGSGDGTVTEPGSRAEVFRLASAIENPTVKMEMKVTDAAISFNERTSPNGALFQVIYRNDAGANVAVQAAAVDNAPIIEARGTNANINLIARGKGTGRFGFGTFASSADAPVTGYIEIIDVSGTVRKLAVIA